MVNTASALLAVSEMDSPDSTHMGLKFLSGQGRAGALFIASIYLEGSAFEVSKRRKMHLK